MPNVFMNVEQLPLTKNGKTDRNRLKEMYREGKNVDKKEFEKAIKEFETPAYIFDLDILKERVLLIKQILSPACTCFAMKANPFLIKPMDEYTDRFEVCSPGNMRSVCVRALHRIRSWFPG